ncbi:MAG: transcription termination/antitermination protein NusG [Waddliaceae bacterium]|nr:transcription termination/antitermination protein NusG [Waddliaceae bacterium]MBT3579080.1 transcription termination/antitermination protein NusG [Waddliaceae bacterium]MBT4444791.1 transcription termination/antitermination protein NusG [Waddliaceae bacterium]MBT6928060.1 transcription termination/antitermination protein NusG [Waddliaceae bacterium]MBT7264444.1 transcription termination/antitermination protein NusG [Waddliaceae bacterium]
MHKWYVLQVMSSLEKKTKKALEENRNVKGMNDDISEVLLPTENVSEVKNGKRQVVEKRLWPGYLLIKMVLNDDSWSYVKNTNGVIGFLGGENPQPLTDNEMVSILDDLKDKKESITQKYQFEIGSKVKIIDGVFINFVGEITEVFPEKGRISVKVSIFGRDTRVDDLELWQVEEVTEE